MSLGTDAYKLIIAEHGEGTGHALVLRVAVHELRNVLHRIRMEAWMLQRALEGGDATKRLVADVDRNVSRADRMLQRLVLFAHDIAPRRDDDPKRRLAIASLAGDLQRAATSIDVDEEPVTAEHCTREPS